MIPNTNTGSIVNPDYAKIRERSIVDISVTLTDVSASINLQQVDSTFTVADRVRLNYDNTEIVILDDPTQTGKFNRYYTPLYTEKISYSEWKKRIDKSFQELEIR